MLDPMVENAESPSSDALVLDDPQLHTTVRRFAQHVVHRMASSWEVELDADDLAQESLAKLLEGGLSKLRQASNVDSYLYTLVRTTMLMRVRSVERRRRREEASLPDSEASDDASGGVLDRLQVDAILRRLDERCQKLLRRVFLEEVPYPELATKMGLAESSVRAKVSRCVTRARSHVG